MLKIEILMLLIVWCHLIDAAHRTRRKEKFVRLPSGLTFPASAAANFQRDTFVPSTFLPPRSPPRFTPLRDAANEYNILDGVEGTKTQESSYVEYNKSPEIGGVTPANTVSATTTISASTVSVASSKSDLEASVIGGGDAGEGMAVTTTAATMGMKKASVVDVAEGIQHRFSSLTKEQQQHQKAHTYTALGGGQFYQSILGGGGKGSFSPLSFFLNSQLAGSNGNGVFVPVPIVIPPPPPPPPGPKCYTNPSGFLCCNVTLEKAMEQAYLEAKAEGISLCNVQKMATAVQEKAEKKFGTTFESVAAHKDFVAKINFAGDLNCKIEIDGKFILAYATPLEEQDVNIVDANSFFSGSADKDLEGVNGTKPTYIVYGPIK